MSKNTEHQELISGYTKIFINSSIPSSAYEAIKSFKELTESMGRDFQKELKKCANETQQGLIGYVLSNAIYKGSNGNSEAIELAIEVISSGIVDLQKPFSNILAPNEQATLKFYAASKEVYSVVEVIEQIERQEHTFGVEVSGDYNGM